MSYAWSYLSVSEHGPVAQRALHPPCPALGSKRVVLSTSASRADCAKGVLEVMRAAEISTSCHGTEERGKGGPGHLSIHRWWR